MTAPTATRKQARMAAHNLVILGGYGNFGKRIADNLRDLPALTLWLAGRNPDRATQLAQLLQAGASVSYRPLHADINDPYLADTLSSVSADLVIHTAGPFQGQDDRVARACLAAGAHYIDLADDRRFVQAIARCDAEARAQQLLMISGASSVPGLSSVVLDHFQGEFKHIDAIDIAIAPGNRVERGSATVEGILSYLGAPFPVFEQGRWIDKRGWLDLKRRDFGPRLGRRWLANVEVPDLGLFPERYQVSRRVSFQAGLELPLLHFTLAAMALLGKWRLVRHWPRWTSLIVKSSDLLAGLGTDVGAMQIHITGRNHQQQPHSLCWRLIAEDGTGPNIPTIAATQLARQLLTDELSHTGAIPCLGLFDYQALMPYLARWRLHVETIRNG